MEDIQFLNKFTQREKDIFACILKGHSNKIIASLLEISEHTVEQHLQHIYIKLKVGSRAKAVWLYWQAVSKN